MIGLMPPAAQLGAGRGAALAVYRCGGFQRKWWRRATLSNWTDTIRTYQETLVGACRDGRWFLSDSVSFSLASPVA